METFVVGQETPTARSATLDRVDALPTGARTRIGSPRFSHPGQITAAALSPDGCIVATAGRDFVTRLWEVATGKELGRLVTPDRIPATLAFSPDGGTIALGSDSLLRLYEVPSGKELATFQDKDSAAFDLAFSPDGKVLAAAGGDDGVIYLWDVKSGKNLRQLNGARGWAATIAFAPDGKTLATAGGELRQKDFAIRLWDPVAGKLVHSLQGHEKPVVALAFSPDGRSLASGSEDGTIRLWDRASGKEISQRKGQPFAARSLAYSSDGKTLAAAEGSGYRLWDIAAGTERHLSWKPEAAQDRALAIAFLPKDRVLITASENASLRFWDADSGKEHGHQQGPSSGLRELIFAGNALAGIDDGPLIHIWDAATGKRLHLLSPDGKVSCLAASPDGISLVAGTGTGTLHRWDLPSGREERLFLDHAGVHGATFSLDSKTLAAVTEGKRGLAALLHMWNDLGGLKKPVKVHILGDQIARLLGIDAEKRLPLDEVGLPLLTVKGWQKLDGASDATTLGFCFFPAEHLLRIRVGEQVFVGQISGAPRIAPERFWRSLTTRFSPDNKMLMTADKKGQIQFQEVAANGQSRGNLDTVPVESLAFSSDGRLLAIGQPNGQLSLYDLPSQKELRRLAAHSQSITALAFSFDGQRLATGSSDRQILIWDVMTLVKNQRPRAIELEANELAKLWSELASTDAKAAYQAVRRLEQAPAQAVRFLQQRTTPVEKMRLERLIADLDSDEFQVRQQATVELEKLAEQTETALNEALAKKPSLEVRQRIEKILQQIQESGPRSVRAVEVLEHINTAEARQLLAALAQGPQTQPRTCEAQAALERLKRLPLASH
jgi:WD40 repeat protein